MARHSIELTDEEQALRAQLHFNFDDLRGSSALAVANGERAALLMESLIGRNAIPPVRWVYWTDPSYHHGRIKCSHKGLFERNGTKGREIYEHPHFLKYLKYMLDGSALPARIIERFCERVEDCGHVSGGDAIDLAQHARSDVRQAALEAAQASEEFYKLALDCGVAEMWANSIREQVRGMRSR